MVGFFDLPRLDRVTIVIESQDDQSHEGDNRAEDEERDQGVVDDILGLFQRRQGGVALDGQLVHPEGGEPCNRPGDDIYPKGIVLNFWNLGRKTGRSGT